MKFFRKFQVGFPLDGLRLLEHTHQTEYFYHTYGPVIRRKIRLEKDQITMIDYYHHHGVRETPLTPEDWKKWQQENICWMTVHKDRMSGIYEYQGILTRVCWDRVKGLPGSFLRLEVSDPDKEPSEIFDHWTQEFHLRPEQRNDTPYADLLLDEELNRQNRFLAILMILFGFLIYFWIRKSAK